MMNICTEGDRILICGDKTMIVREKGRDESTVSLSDMETGNIITMDLTEYSAMFADRRAGRLYDPRPAEEVCSDKENLRRILAESGVPSNGVLCVSSLDADEAKINMSHAIGLSMLLDEYIAKGDFTSPFIPPESRICIEHALHRVLLAAIDKAAEGT